MYLCVVFPQEKRKKEKEISFELYPGLCQHWQMCENGEKWRWDITLMNKSSTEAQPLKSYNPTLQRMSGVHVQSTSQLNNCYQWIAVSHLYYHWLLPASHPQRTTTRTHASFQLQEEDTEHHVAVPPSHGLSNFLTKKPTPSDSASVEYAHTVSKTLPFLL